MRTNYYLLLLLFFCTCVPALSHAQQATIEGKVIDAESREGLIGATVALFMEGSFVNGTTTDFDGNYRFSNVDPATYDIKVEYTGYPPVLLTGIPVAAGRMNNADVVMAAGVNLEEIVVVGYAVPLIKKDNTTSGQTVTSEEIKNLPTRSVNQIGAITAGASSAKASKKMAIHGSRSNGTDYYVDGIRVSGRSALTDDSATGRARREPDSTEQYNTITENPFRTTKEAAVSTLSTDVDRAAYANVRRFLYAGQLPPPDAVRTEEMINYFRYADGAPTDKSGIAMRTEVAECPWNTDNYLLRVNVSTTPIATEDVPASNLVFLLDVSGSMSSHNKLPLLKQSLGLLVDQFGPKTGSVSWSTPGPPGSSCPPLRATCATASSGHSTG